MVSGGGGNAWSTSQQHGNAFLLEAIRNLPGVTAAMNDRLEFELGGEVERPADLIACVRLEDHRQLAIEIRSQRGEGGIERRTLARLLAILEQLP